MTGGLQSFPCFFPTHNIMRPERSNRSALTVLSPDAPVVAQHQQQR